MPAKLSSPRAGNVRPVSEPASEQLRADLAVMRDRIGSAAKLLKLMHDAETLPEIGDDWLNRFIDYKPGKLDGKTLRSEVKAKVSTFTYKSAIGRALRRVAPSTRTNFDALVEAMAEGGPYWMAGRYFVYHGSYIEPGHFVVRVIDIRGTDESTLDVIDIIQDTRDRNELLVAKGCAVAFGDSIHIVTSGKDNRIGLGLFVGTSLRREADALQRAVGSQLGMTKHLRRYQRACMIERIVGPEADGDIKDAPDVLSKTGIFKFMDLTNVQQAAFRTLAKQFSLKENAEDFPDPITTSFPD